MSYIEQTTTLIQEQVDVLKSSISVTYSWFKAQPLWKRGLLTLVAMIILTIVTVMLVFHKPILKHLISISDSWYELNYGVVLLFSLLFICGFPPLFGFATLAMLSGMVYGFPNGWYILASSTTLGSYGTFILYRSLLRNQATRLVNSSEKFKALAEILSEDSSLSLLILIRVCPLPYSLLNGVLALVPNLSRTNYFLASLISSPRLLMYVYIGHKMKDLGSETRTGKQKIVDLLSIFAVDLITVFTGWLIYRRMTAKLLGYRNAREEGHIDGVDEFELDSDTDSEP